ncbi:hypothetical protein RHDC4_03261 [Rhodocyclaceae bacterium]|nr:hypothetical protein RHDC4_03261 [Rhodocyclaceae bacterium]
MNINTAFLNSISPEAKAMIINSIAAHYDTTADAIIEEVCAEDAEGLLDYMVEPARSAASVLMQKHGFR